MESPSHRIVLQRIRNRIIEVLEVVASFQEQERIGGDEVINMWEDWVDESRLPEYVEPVFSKPEQAAIAEFNQTWEFVAEHTPQFLPPICDLKVNEFWLQLMSAARIALNAFSTRGKFTEDAELTDAELSGGV